MKQDPVSEAENGSLVGQRYELRERIGRGGMADVYRARDTVAGRWVALKRLRPDEDEARNRQSETLFRREYHTLVQLSHPRIVEALDYGVEAGAPYFTMELLDGGDIADHSPLSWQQTCVVARDICSALSLVHSRRMVFRDLSPRNVRCTSDGKAKLIDFGAMAPMGPGRLAVCTPAVAAPEVVRGGQLDGRSDLYALGATLYRSLTGRNPFPARTFQQLEGLWQHPPRPPSDYVPDIPAALNELLLEMIQVDPALRPASAAEVSQRISAIAGLATDEVPLISQAYLTTPALVGREEELRRTERRIRRLSTRGRGSATLLRGPAGSGRTRLLDACVVQGKLNGLTVVRVSGAEAADVPNAISAALLSRLVVALPEETLDAVRAECSALAEPLGALLENMSAEHTPLVSATVEPVDAGTLKRVVCRVAQAHALFVAVDDVDRLDPNSRAAVALLAHEVDALPIGIVVSDRGESAGDTEADRLLVQACTVLELGPLDAEHTRELFTSVFGAVPNVRGFAARAHSLAGGSPQDLMRLAQHAVDRGIVQYRDGAWKVPERIDEAELPANMAQAYDAAVEALDADARSLALAIAQCPEERFSVQECLQLTEHRAYARLFRSLDALLTTGVLSAAGDHFSLSGPAWARPLTDSVPPEVHRRLAAAFEARGDGIRAARHLFAIGEHASGLDRLVAHAIASARVTNNDPDAYVALLASLPKDWKQLYETGLGLCRALDRPAAERRALQVRVGGIYSQQSACSDGMQAEWTQQLAREAGLDVYETLDAALPPAERMKQALGAAAQRFENTPERDRGYAPKEAIGHLARAVISIIGNIARTLDLNEWRQVPSLGPLASLSPSVAVVHQLAVGFDARSSGRFEDARKVYDAILEQFEAGAGAELPETFVNATQAGVTSTLGMLEAVLGLSSSANRAHDVEKYPIFQGSALAIQTLFELWQGRITVADELTRKRELWSLEQPRQTASDLQVLLWTLPAHALCDDLTHTRESLDAVERIASQVPSWDPIASWGRGEYERIRGDYPAALAALDSALARLPAGKHQVWPFAAAARVKVLCAQQHYEEARTAGEAYLATAVEAGLGYARHFVELPVAEAAANLGDADAAWNRAHAAIAGFEKVGARGLTMGMAYEAAARVARLLEDRAEFERYSQRCEEHYPTGQNPALAAKWRRLMAGVEEEGRREWAVVEPRPKTLTVATSRIAAALEACTTSTERLQRGLQLLTGPRAERGYLYGLVDGTVQLRAQSDDEPLAPKVHARAVAYLERMLEQQDAETEAVVADVSTDSHWEPGVDGGYRPLLLTHSGPEGLVISGLVILECRGDCNPPDETVSELSRVVVDNGDLVGYIVA